MSDDDILMVWCFLKCILEGAGESSQDKWNLGVYHVMSLLSGCWMEACRTE